MCYFLCSYGNFLVKILRRKLPACKFTDGDTIKIDADSHKFTFEKVG